MPCLRHHGVYRALEPCTWTSRGVVSASSVWATVVDRVASSNQCCVLLSSCTVGRIVLGSGEVQTKHRATVPPRAASRSEVPCGSSLAPSLLVAYSTVAKRTGVSRILLSSRETRPGSPPPNPSPRIASGRGDRLQSLASRREARTTLTDAPCSVGNPRGSARGPRVRYGGDWRGRG